MKEVRPPKRPLIFYYCVAMLILLLFNFLAMPWMARQQIQEVDYGTFMDMAENQDLGQVEIQEQENQIVFTNTDETALYSTAMIPDPDLKQMLKDSGAEFSGQVIQQTDPIFQACKIQMLFGYRLPEYRLVQVPFYGLPLCFLQAIQRLFPFLLSIHDCPSLHISQDHLDPLCHNHFQVFLFTHHFPHSLYILSSFYKSKCPIDQDVSIHGPAKQAFPVAGTLP